MRWHDDDYVPVQEGGLDRLDLPADVDAGQIIDSYVGSPMYAVIPEHAPAVLFLVSMYGAFWWMRRRQSPRLDAYFRLSKVHRFLAWLLAISGVGHLALVFTHEPSSVFVMKFPSRSPRRISNAKNGLPSDFVAMGPASSFARRSEPSESQSKATRSFGPSRCRASGVT